MGKIIYTINNIKYILFEIEISIKQRSEIEKRIKKIGGIIQAVKSKEGFLWNKSILIKYLIPEDTIIELRKIKDKTV